MISDYLRAAAGFAPALAILVFSSPGPVGRGIVAAFAALFALFGLRAALRHATVIEASETELRASGPLAAAIRWGELDQLRLAYFSTHRDKRDGWMQLDLRGGRSNIRLDSRIDGFNELVERAALAAAACGLELNAATAANLEALGVRHLVLPNIAGMAGGRA